MKLENFFLRQKHTWRSECDLLIIQNRDIRAHKINNIMIQPNEMYIQDNESYMFYGDVTQIFVKKYDE